MKSENTEYFKFKSNIAFFYKEKEGIKNNTVRKIKKQDLRFKKLKEFKLKGFKLGQLKIIITLNDPFQYKKDFFIREIKDISIYHNLIIITWEHKKQ